MTLTICIPVYNFDVNELVNDLTRQIDNQNLEGVNIVLIDDASNQTYKSINSNLEEKVNRFIYLENNIGRSKIRNLFLNYSKSEYLLFLDCDGKIINENFLKIYIDFISKMSSDVIYGGRKVSENQPSSNYRLRWRFAVKRENLPLEVRLRSPYLDFQTNNFVVKKQVLEQVPFNENITQYGYEDLIFSRDLKHNKFKIQHIENPVLNNDVETNSDFLVKADHSALSLAQLLGNDDDLERVKNIRLAEAYLLLKKTGTAGIYSFFYYFTKSTITKILLSGNAPLKLLDLYKLGQLIGYMNKFQSNDRS